jgi:transcriptional regulator with XRE-family HTH domain
MEIFAHRIRERSAELGLSLAQAARKADVSERSFAHYAAQRSEPDLATLVKIARALGVSADYLLGLADAATSDASTEQSDQTGIVRQRIAATATMLEAPALQVADSVLVSLLELERGYVARIKQGVDGDPD